jgi:hypothetical protein
MRGLKKVKESEQKIGPENSVPFFNFLQVKTLSS